MNEDLLRLLQDVTDSQTRQAAIDLFNSVSQGGRNVEQALLAVRRTYVDIVAQSRDFTQSLIAATQAVQTTNVGLSQARKAQRSLVSISQKLQDNFAGISDLSLKDLYTLRAKAKQDKARLEDSAKAILQGKEYARLTGEELRLRVASELSAGNLTDQQAEVLNQYSDGFGVVGDFISSINDAVGDQEQLNRSLGLTGAALNNLNRIGVRALGGLGVNLGTLEQDLKKAEQAAVDAVEKMRLEEGVNFDEQKAKARALRAALPGVGKALGTALVDPLTIGLFSTQKLIKAFTDLNQAQTDFRRVTGTTAETFSQISSNAANAVEVIEVGVELTKQIGMNAEEVFGPETLLQITEAKNLLGLSAEQAGRIAIANRVSGENMSLFKKGIEAGAKSSNKLFKSGISTGLALQDALSASDGIALSLGMSGERLGEAATAARALGLELSAVDEIANSLLNFESSIENELQAQLLTGKQLNLTRARELALNNDLAGLSGEIKDNIVTGTEFAGMNRIAQEGLASAIGVSRDQLARMVIQQDINNKLTGEQRANMMGLTLDQYQAQTAAESLRRSFQGIAQSIVGIVEPFADFVTKNENLLKILISTAAVFKSIQLATSAITSYTKLQAALEARKGALIGGQNVMYAVQVSLKRKGVAADTASMVAMVIANPIKSIAGLALAGLATAAVYKQFNKAKDGMIDPKGGLVVSEPAGSFGVQLNPKDQILAGTDLNRPSQSTSSVTDSKPMLDVLTELLNTVKRGSTINIDGAPIGKAVTMTSVKSS